MTPYALIWPDTPWRRFALRLNGLRPADAPGGAGLGSDDAPWRRDATAGLWAGAA